MEYSADVTSQSDSNSLPAITLTQICVAFDQYHIIFDRSVQTALFQYPHRLLSFP